MIKPYRSWDIHVHRTHCNNSLRYALAEWLRRWPGNLVGDLRAGSIPDLVFLFFFLFLYDYDGGAKGSGTSEREA